MEQASCLLKFKQEEWARDIITPPKQQDIIHRKKTFFQKAANFGFIIPLSFPLWVKEKEAIFRIAGIDTIIEAKNKVIIIPLGFKFKIPETHAYYNYHLLDKNSFDYVVDMETHSDGWYTPKLVLKPRKRSSFEPGTHALKILPILDLNYDFIYNREEG